jgi:hypothetical protein
MSTVFFDTLFDHLIKAYGLTHHRRSIDAIRDILFAGFDPDVLFENQKCDVSFSFSRNKKEGLRFSYNDTKEEAAAIKKARRVFSFLGTGYNQLVAKKLLDAISTRAIFKRMALGIDWPCGQSSPRVKIYLCNDTADTTATAKYKSFAKTVCGWLGWNSAFLDKTAFADISVVAIDFFADHTCDLKIYSRMAYPNEIAAPALCPKGKQRIGQFIKTASQEPRAFYYVARRWHEAALEPQSIKLHKIYETNQMPDARCANAEISRVLKVFGYSASSQARLIKAMGRISAQKHVRSYPVAVSLDTDRLGSSRLDIYYAFMPKSNTLTVKAPASGDPL